MTAGYRPTHADVLASTDVLRDIDELSDSLDPVDAIEYRVVVEKVLAAAKQTIDLLNTQLIRTMEAGQEIVRDGRMFYVSHKEDRARFDHSAIAGRVIRRSVEPLLNTETGEVYDPTAEDSARRAVQLMSDIYLSDSTKAKVTVLDLLEIKRTPNVAGSVLSVEWGDKVVKDRPA